MQIILFMTLSGSLLFLMVNLIQFFKPNIFSLRQRHNMLKIALLLHFIPLPILIFFIKRNNIQKIQFFPLYFSSAMITIIKNPL